MSEHVVAHTGELDDGEMKQVSVEDTDLLLVRRGNEYHAVYGHCSHYGAPLAQGALSGDRVVCPWHHACFDVRTGRQLDPPGRENLETFETRVEDTDVLVELPDEVTGLAPASMSRRDEDAGAGTAVIVGAGAAGAHAAEAARAAGFEGRLVLVTGEEDGPYDRPNCSKDYLSGEAREEWMPLRDRDFYEKRDVELWTERPVARIDVRDTEVTFEDGETLRADQLVIATGGRARTLDVPGAERPGVYTLRSWADSRRIRARAEEAERAVIVGASFIGMEAAQSLRHHDLEIRVVAPEEVPFARILGNRIGGILRSLHERHGAEFHLGRTVDRFEGEGDEEAVRQVVLDDGTELEADLVVVGVGVRPATEIVEGIETAGDGSIPVDAQLRAAEDVYAAGDLARFPDPRTGEPIRVEHWRLAQQHGEIAGANLAGAGRSYEGVPFFWTGQLGRNVRYVGHAPDWDEVIFDGEPTDREFLAFYVSDGEIRALAGLDRDREMAAAEELMRLGRLPDPEEVRGEASDLITRLRAGR